MLPAFLNTLVSGILDSRPLWPHQTQGSTKKPLYWITKLRTSSNSTIITYWISLMSLSDWKELTNHIHSLYIHIHIYIQSICISICFDFVLLHSASWNMLYWIDFVSLQFFPSMHPLTRFAIQAWGAEKMRCQNIIICPPPLPSILPGYYPPRLSEEKNILRKCS